MSIQKVRCGGPLDDYSRNTHPGLLAYWAWHPLKAHVPRAIGPGLRTVGGLRVGIYWATEPGPLDRIHPRGGYILSYWTLASGPYPSYGRIPIVLLDLGLWTVGGLLVGIYCPTGPWPLDRIHPRGRYILYCWTLDYGL